MKLTHFISLVFAALVALVAGAGLLSNQQGEQSFEQKVLIDNFDFDSVHKVIIQGQEYTTEMNKVMASWQVSQFSNYPADVTLLSSLLQQLKTVTIQEYKTSNSNNYHRLGLVEVDIDGSEATLISLVNNNDEIKLLLGNEAKSGAGRYAKLGSSTQTYLLDSNLAIKSDPKAWLAQRILPYDLDEIRRLNWLDNEGAAFSIERKEQIATGELEVQNGQPLLPTGEVKLKADFELVSPIGDFQPMYNSVFTGLVRNTNQLELQNVLPKSETKLSAQEAIYSIELLAEQKSNVHSSLLRFYQTPSEEYWLEVEGSQWVYQISEFSFKQLGKPIQDYLAE